MGPAHFTVVVASERSAQTCRDYHRVGTISADIIIAILYSMFDISKKNTEMWWSTESLGSQLGYSHAWEKVIRKFFR